MRLLSFLRGGTPGGAEETSEVGGQNSRRGRGRGKPGRLINSIFPSFFPEAPKATANSNWSMMYSVVLSKHNLSFKYQWPKPIEKQLWSFNSLLTYQQFWVT